MRSSVVLLASLVLGAAACGDDKTSAPPGTMMPPEGSGGAGGSPEAPAPLTLDPPPAGEGFQIAAAPFLVQPGQEVYYCERVKLPVDADFDVQRIHARYSNGAHHLLVLSVDEEYPPLHGTCDAGTLGYELSQEELVRNNLRFIGGSQTPYLASPESDGTFDEGLAIRVRKGATILLQQHFLNTGPAPVEAKTLINVHFARTPPQKLLESFFFYHIDVDVPAHAEADAAARCTFPPGTEVLGMVSHMHKRGVWYKAHEVVGDALGQMLYETTEWQEPQMKTWPGNAMLQMGGKTVEYRCHYKNESDQRIQTGESGEYDEMCMLIGFYTGGTETLWGLPGVSRAAWPGNPCVAVP